MRGDFSRQTFNRDKHYAGVLLQQGRVAVDADWNEQGSIDRYRIETEAVDVIGITGTPLDAPDFTDASGFRIRLTADSTSFTIGQGRYYVDGLLAENDDTIDYRDQGAAPYELPSPPPILNLLSTPNAVGLIYLDVWQRHITPLDDSLIQEKALGDVDTATRMRTAWQVKVLPVPDVSAPIACNANLKAWDALVTPSSGTLTVRARRSTTAPDPCEPPPSAGYTRLENQLYRVEIHRGGTSRGGNGTPGATFKWSRENGSILTDVRGFAPNDWITVGSMGRDAELGFAKDQWVELINDLSELNTDGTVRGQLTKIIDLDPGKNAIRLADAPADPSLARSPRLRRWDMIDRPAPEPVSVTTDGILVQPDVEVPLEDGIVVKFSAGAYHDGDYWLIPARTANGDVEWPNAASSPLAQPPAGIKHHRCRLGFIRVGRTPSLGLQLLTDCRHKFPPLTELTSFFYVGGDGQEVMPEASDSSAHTVVALPQPLQVGVARGAHPVENAVVRFEVVNPGSPGGGSVNGAPKVDVLTGPNGVASCTWEIASDQKSQQVMARLLIDDAASSHVPVVFSAQRSRADEVRYFPPPACTTLAPAHDVQSAIDRLGELVHLEYVSGDAQEVPPAERAVLRPLVVRVWNACGPVAAATVRFSRLEGGESITPEVTSTDTQGLASAKWVLDGSNTYQRAVAKLDDAGPNAGPQASIHGPTSSVEFSARLDRARPDQPVIVVRAVNRGDGKPLVNDADITLSQLLPGPDRPAIEVVTDRPLDLASVGGKKTMEPFEAPNAHPSFYVTIELPWPTTPGDRQFWSGGDLPFGFQPIVLCATVRQSGTSVFWTPSPPTERWLPTLLRVLLNARSRRLLVRLTLKGAFVRDKDGVFLDGDPFGPKSSVNFRDTSGDGEPGGDFELWFWLVTDPL